MTTWTKAATDELESYFTLLRPSLLADGADPAEVIEDLRRHVQQEARAGGFEVVTEADVRRLLSRIGAPTLPAGANAAAPTPAAAADPAPPPSPARRPSAALLVFGVVLPVIALAIEMITGMCAGAFFDPVPTVWHRILVALVPLANALVWHAAATGQEDWRARLGWLNGAAIGIAAFYSLMYLPLLLPGLLAVVFFGWGLLPWSPVLSLVCAILLRRHLRHLGATAIGPRLPGLWGGLAFGCLALLVVDLPVTSTRVALQAATEEDSQARQRGIQWLRRLGHEPTLRRACYGRTQSAASLDLTSWIFGGRRVVSAGQAREVYYRVTGQPFNARPAPEVRTARGAFAELDEWTWDDDQGGDQVGGRLKGLTLLSSRLDANVNADAATGYCEWILEFKNDSRRQHEARAQVLLPPGGVVSRLTLWINGEEREAAFGGRSQVRQAYQEVAIRQRRDPVLVTTAGPDRVLLQCFPVPPNGGIMKVRVGITAPLRLERLESGEFRWPSFIERNFTIPPGSAHSVWLEATGARQLTADGLASDEPRPGVRAIHGSLPDVRLAGGTAGVRVDRNPARTQAWARSDPTRGGDAGQVIRQTLEAHPGTRHQRLVLVLDGSRGMAAHREKIASALRSLPAACEVVLVQAADGNPAPGLIGNGQPVRPAEVAAMIPRLAFSGGMNNLPALERAWDWAATNGDTAIVWIHGAQPVLLGSTEALRQRYERRPAGPLIFAVQIASGPNRILEQLDGIPRIQWVPTESDAAAGLQRLLASLANGAPAIVPVRERVGSAQFPLPAELSASSHLERLWAAEEIERLRAARRLDAAQALASRQQLVTPVSGAVVLETAQQYVQHGLTPADPATVPSIPEPGTWALLLGGLVALLWGRRRTRLAGN